MKIIIRHYEFKISEPYAPGPAIISEGEAQAFNSHRADRIRNNVDQWVAEAEAADGADILSPSELAELQSRISAYDKSYSFEPRKSSSPRQSSLAREVYNVAVELVDAQARAAGIEPAGARVEADIALLLSEPSVQAEARRRLSIREEIINRSIDELIS